MRPGGGLGGINVWDDTRRRPNMPRGPPLRIMPSAQNISRTSPMRPAAVFSAGIDAWRLNAAFEGIAEELRRQYNIGYVPKDEGVIGPAKLIKVRVNRPSLVIRSTGQLCGRAANSNAPPQTVQPSK